MREFLDCVRTRFMHYASEVLSAWKIRHVSRISGIRQYLICQTHILAPVLNEQEAMIKNRLYEGGIV